MLDKLKEIVTKEIDKLHTKATSNDSLSNEDFNVLYMLMNHVERIRVLEANTPLGSN